jgi:hypothetical protein
MLLKMKLRSSSNKPCKPQELIRMIALSILNRGIQRLDLLVIDYVSYVSRQYSGELE